MSSDIDRARALKRFNERREVELEAALQVPKDQWIRAQADAKSARWRKMQQKLCSAVSTAPESVTRQFPKSFAIKRARPVFKERKQKNGE